MLYQISLLVDFKFVQQMYFQFCFVGTENFAKQKLENFFYIFTIKQLDRSKKKNTTVGRCIDTSLRI